MPTMLPALQGVSLSEALAEAATIAPVDRAMLDTLEIWHEDFTEPGFIVNDNQAFEGTLEDDAPRQAAETVTYQPVRFRAEWPEENADAAAAGARIAADGVTPLLVEQLRLARGSLSPVVAVWRIYASDDPSGPARLPVVTFELGDVVTTETTVSFELIGYHDPVNTRFPARAYTRLTHPGLAAQ